MRKLRGYLILSLALATGALSLAAARSSAASVLPVACGVGALVAAIHSANAGAADTLVLAADCTYKLRAVDNDNKGPNGLPAITSAVTIVGNRAVIQRSTNPATPPFRLFFVDTTGNLTLQDLTIRNGQAAAGSPGLRGPDPVLCQGTAGRKGGGIFNQGTLTLTNSALRANRAGAGGHGAAVCDAINCSELAGCLGGVGGAGGGIFNRGALTVTNSALTDNVSGRGGSGGRGENSGHGSPGTNAGAGGAIFNAGTLRLVNTTLSNNRGGTGGDETLDGFDGGRGGHGGGIANRGTATLVNSTIHGNIGGSGGDADCGDEGAMGTGGSGGGIANWGSLTIQSSTITDNRVGPKLHGGDCHHNRAGVGGGIFNDGGAFTLVNSIVEGMGIVDDQPTGEDCSGTLPSTRRYSLGSRSCGDDEGDPLLITGAARLGPLGDYGGPTETRVPLLGSDAIDRGDPAGCLDAEGHRLKDQRGFPRRRQARCDIGAVELQPGEVLPDAIQARP